MPMEPRAKKHTKKQTKKQAPQQDLKQAEQQVELQVKKQVKKQVKQQAKSLKDAKPAEQKKGAKPGELRKGAKSGEQKKDAKAGKLKKLDTKPGKLKKLVVEAAHRLVAGELPALDEPAAEVLSSEIVYRGKLFNVVKDEVREPNGHVTQRDVIRHNGSVVILPIDASKSRKDPLVILERQYRHAAGQYLWEIPAGKIEPGEERLAGAKRELAEETGYQAARWTELVRYFASPGFLGEWMQVYLAEELTPGTATPEADETLEVFALPLSEVEKLIEQGKILDGKTLIGISLYKLLLGRKKKKKK